MKEMQDGTTPPDTAGLRLSKVKTTAAGIPAAVSSLNHGIRKMGLTKTVRTLLMVNQKEGFDCPGCAWPDPEHRTSFEFCENGAKAVADEAMKAKVNASFFQKHPISDLLERSDFWLNSQGRIAQPMIRKSGSNHYQPIDWDDAFDFRTHTNDESPRTRRLLYFRSYFQRSSISLSGIGQSTRFQ